MRIMDELRRIFRPEFLNRVDETVLFKPLKMDEVVKIVGLQLEDLEKRLASQGLKLKVTGGVADLIARRSYDPVYGARPLKRFIQQMIETPVARRIIGGEATEGCIIELKVDGDNIAVQ